MAVVVVVVAVVVSIVLVVVVFRAGFGVMNMSGGKEKNSFSSFN